MKNILNTLNNCSQTNLRPVSTMSAHLIKSLFFILFVAAFVGWVYFNARSGRALRHDPTIGASVWFQEQQLLVNYSAIFVFLYLLSGFWSLELVIFTFAIIHVGLLLAAGSRWLLGTEQDKYYAHVLWSGAEIGLRYPWTFISIAAGAALISIGYLVFAVWAYFFAAWPQALLTRTVLQATLIPTLLSGLLFNLVVIVPVLASKNVDENTRIRAFLDSLAQMIPSAFLCTFGFFAFGGGDQDLRAFGNTIFTLSALQIWIGLIGFFFVTVFAPLLVGRYRARAWRDLLMQRRRTWLTKAANSLSVPASADYATRLQQLRADVVTARRAIEQDDIVVFGEELSKAPAAEDGLSVLARAYAQCRDTDPRVSYLDWMRGFDDQSEYALQRIIDNLNAQATESAKQRLAAKWSKELRQRRTDLDEEHKAQEERSSPVIVLGAALIAPIGSAILTGAGQHLWRVFAAAPP